MVALEGQITPLPDGGLPCSNLCASLNASYLLGCSLAPLPDGGPGVCCEEGGGTGRLPITLLPSERAQGSALGAFFARATRLEAASIDAFGILERELTAHRAPAALTVWARSSAAEEVRHARLTAALARRYGAEPTRATCGVAPDPRTLEEIALENALEGCVRETFGALLAHWQAAHATDPVVRQAMAVIAEDETRHAELGWEVAAWCETRLSQAARRRVREERARAFAALERDPGAGPASRAAGIPPPHVAAALARRLSGWLLA